MDDPEAVLGEIADVLWPRDGTRPVWNPETLEQVAQALRDAGFAPADEDDPHVGAPCALCEDPIGPDEGCGGPNGSVHERCLDAAENTDGMAVDR